MSTPAPRSAVRTRIVLITALWVALATGCSSFTARVAGWYITREVDSYMDLESDQRSWLRARVDALLEELRRDDLYHWVHLLRRARDTVDQGATEARLAKLQERYDALMDRGVDRLAPLLGELLAKLDDEQINYFEERMLEQLDETYEEQTEADSERERRQMLDEKLIDAIEDLTDDLSDSQRRIILARVHELPDERPTQYRVGKERIHAGADFLRAHDDPRAIEAELRRLWETRYEVLGENRGKKYRRKEQREVLLTIDRVLTREQRDHAVEEINDRIQTVKRLLLPRKPG